MPRIVKRPEVRVREILDTARSLFVEKGYVQTTIEEIARTMSVAKGMVYHYFRSKEDIFDAVLQREIHELADEVRTQCFAIDGSALDKLHAFLSYLSGLLGREDLLFARLQPNECLHLFAQANVICVQELLPMVIDVVRQGMDEGVVRVYDPDTTALIMISGTFALALQHQVEPDSPRDMAALSAAGRDFYTRMLGIAPG